jgi:hypothetical protein
MLCRDNCHARDIQPVLACTLQGRTAFYWVGGEREGGQEERIALDGVVAQSTSIYSNERTLACALSTTFR